MTKNEVQADIRKILLELLGDTDFKVQTESGTETGWTFGKTHVAFTEVSGKFEIRLNRESWCGTIERYDHEVARHELAKLIWKRPLGFLESKLGTLNLEMLVKTGEVKKIRMEYNAENDTLGISCLEKDGKISVYKL
jgi:hypothetical protein